MNTIIIILLVTALVGGLILYAQYAKQVGMECAFCGGRALLMDQMPKEERSKLYKYFWKVEQRVPFAETVYVCTDCHKINDDYITGHNPRGMVIRCKSCKKTTNLGATTTCHVCKARYEWVKFKECGDYQFFLPTNRTNT